MATKSLYNKKLGTEVANQARPSKPADYHVISSLGDKWSVVRDGSIKAIKVFFSQDEAISFAQVYANKINGQVIIHDKFGRMIAN